ncbi:MAG TPA: hypothetical protein VHF06_11390 [Pseudonocardiaceae bacterium]|nr:hypothetical protein [Pseudonocardiaceae bacterium]
MAILDGRDLSTCRRFAGYLADRSICTSLVELDEAHRKLWIRLASVSRFSVALDASATDLLIETLDTGGACAVHCEHEHGPRLLGANPNEDPSVIPHSERRLSAPPHGRPMRLYLHLGDKTDDQIAVTFTQPATQALLAHLRACRAAMAAT